MHESCPEAKRSVELKIFHFFHYLTILNPDQLQPKWVSSWKCGPREKLNICLNQRIYLGIIILILEEVQGCNSFYFFNLIFVGFGLLLEVVYHWLHLYMIFHVLVLCVGLLFHMSLRLAKILLSICKYPVFIIRFWFQFLKESVHCTNCLFPPFSAFCYAS